ncbi:MAG: ABC transporter permease [Clostridia bacterium]|nr:ABC transporter permease [Clostridia bacterium]
MNYIMQNPQRVLNLTIEHLQIIIIAVSIAVIIGVPIGIFLTRVKFLQGPVFGIAGVLYTIPALALFAIMIPFFGLGVKPTVIALILYSQLAIIRNTVTGIENIDKSIIEAATGMGMTKIELLLKIQLPLGLPVIMAGIRMVTVMAIGIATIASYIGAGGLGDLIFLGMFTIDTDIILAGAIPIIIMALVADKVLVMFQKRLGKWKAEPKKTTKLVKEVYDGSVHSK